MRHDASDAHDSYRPISAVLTDDPERATHEFHVVLPCDFAMNLRVHDTLLYFYKAGSNSSHRVAKT